VKAENSNGTAWESLLCQRLFSARRRDIPKDSTSKSPFSLVAYICPLALFRVSICARYMTGLFHIRSTTAAWNPLLMSFLSRSGPRKIARTCPLCGRKEHADSEDSEEEDEVEMEKRGYFPFQSFSLCWQRTLRITLE
jgi:hypothetical protein